MSASPRLIVPMLTAALTIACGKDKGTDSACNEGAAMPSVQVVVTDMTASPIADATATWSNGGAENPCEFLQSQFLCGMDDLGAISVTATASGYATQTVDFDVQSDGCHAITEEYAFRMLEE